MDLNSIHRFTDFSLVNAWNLNRGSVPIFNFAVAAAAVHQSLSFQEKIEFINQHESLGNIKASLQAYRPSWCQYIYDLLTGTVLKAYLLRRSVAEISSQIDGIAQPILNDPVVQKVNLVGRAIQYMDENKLNSDLDNRVGQYFMSALDQLHKNQNIPIPRWYHSFFGGVFSHFIKATELDRNFCDRRSYWRPCASSRDEYQFWQGEKGTFTIALDHHNTWKDEPVNYVVKTEKYQSHVHNAIWVYGGDYRIKLNANTIAYCVTSDENKIEELTKKNIPVVSREISERIRYIFEQVEPAFEDTRIVPGNWAQQYLTKEFGKPEWA